MGEEGGKLDGWEKEKKPTSTSVRGPKDWDSRKGVWRGVKYGHEGNQVRHQRAGWPGRT